MENIALIDAHCDTAYELYHRGESLTDNTCHISLHRAQAFSHYAQFFAIWSDKRLDDEACFTQFLSIASRFRDEIEHAKDQIEFVRDADGLDRTWSASKSAAFLAVEDARLLAGKIERLDELRQMGVSYLTLLWGGVSCIGGAHDTDEGLTDFGRSVARGCYRCGICPDVSHASERSTDDVLEIAAACGKTVMATHSNSYSVYAHSRNLRDRHFEAIRSLGGFVGVSLCRSHLTDITARHATVDDVVRHIDRYMELGGEHTVGLGCDFDGTDPPDGIVHLGDLTLLADALLTRGYSKNQVENIFWKNKYEFIKNQIK